MEQKGSRICGNKCISDASGRTLETRSKLWYNRVRTNERNTNLKRGENMKTLAWFIVGLLSLGSSVVRAQDSDADKKQPSVEEQLHALVELGPGVYEIQIGDNGQIESFVVVGQARISTVLGKAKGLEVARNKANLDCSAQLVKWLKEEVQIRESSDEETIILLQGEDSGEAGGLTESGKALERTTKRIESISAGLVRSLQLLHKEVDADGKTLTVVKGWQREISESSKELRESLQSDRQKPKNNSTLQPSIASGNATGKDELGDESATSPAAKSFFQKKRKK